MDRLMEDAWLVDVDLPAVRREDPTVEATLSDGVLHVRLPKPARSRPRQIEVKG